LPPITKDDAVQGSDKAPVTVIEYASLSCPHCARWETDVFPKVKSELIDKGKIRYVFRDFPLNAPALEGAQLAHCDPARFETFVEVLFENQSSWLSDQDPKPELLKIARVGGISEDRFNACMSDDKLRESIVASRQGGEAAGVDATPTFFFNGTMHSGELTYDDFLALVTSAGK
jgi:protein-disulfide isomerase